MDRPYERVIPLLFESIALSIQNFDLRLVVYDSQDDEVVGVVTEHELDTKLVERVCVGEVARITGQLYV